MPKEKKIKHYKTKPNENQKKVFEIMVENIRSGKKINKGNILAKGDYSESMQKTPSRVFESNGFQQLLATIDDSVILARLAQILITGKDGDSLNSAKELLKLKDRYPQRKLKGLIYAEEVDSVMD